MIILINDNDHHHHDNDAEKNISNYNYEDDDATVVVVIMILMIMVIIMILKRPGNVFELQRDESLLQLQIPLGDAPLPFKIPRSIIQIPYFYENLVVVCFVIVVFVCLFVCSKMCLL